MHGLGGDLVACGFLVDFVVWILVLPTVAVCTWLTMCA